jgi:hypothetical protein
VSTEGSAGETISSTENTPENTIDRSGIRSCVTLEEATQHRIRL